MKGASIVKNLPEPRFLPRSGKVPRVTGVVSLDNLMTQRKMIAVRLSLPIYKEMQRQASQAGMTLAAYIRELAEVAAIREEVV
jgi:hypothetical protein